MRETLSLLATSLPLLPRMAAFLLHGALGRPITMPINLTLSVTDRCQSRCLTCRLWDVPSPGPELTLPEIRRLFGSMGRVYFFNVSGGEPFLRPDLAQIVQAAQALLRPRVIHIPSNGLATEAALRTSRSIIENLGPSSLLSLKVSIDGIGPVHDRIRGIDGGYPRALDTLRGLLALRSLRPSQVKVGIATVVSRMNLDQMEAIVALASSLGCDSVVPEVAEVREEMHNQDLAIIPSGAEYLRAVRPVWHLRSQGLYRLLGGFRRVYDEMTATMLDHRGGKALPCHAGLSNGQITAQGEVWPCAVQGQGLSMGKLRSFDMDFARLWQSPRARAVRRIIAKRRCSCPLANQAYANLLLYPPAYSRVVRSLLA